MRVLIVEALDELAEDIHIQIASLLPGASVSIVHMRESALRAEQESLFDIVVCGTCAPGLSPVECDQVPGQFFKSPVVFARPCKTGASADEAPAGAFSYLLSSRSTAMPLRAAISEATRDSGIGRVPPRSG